MAVSVTDPRRSNRLRPSARDSARYRRNPVESGTAERNRLCELLKTANVKLASVATDVFRVYGPLVLEALVIGAATPQEMAQRRQREKGSRTGAGSRREARRTPSIPVEVATRVWNV